VKAMTAPALQEEKSGSISAQFLWLDDAAAAMDWGQ